MFHSISPRVVQLTLSLLALSALPVLTGCSDQMPDREVRMTRSYIYYCDGAGGGGMISNWGGGVRKGMLDAGYNGAGEIFRWNTGLGVWSDQTASNEYKRGKAAELAREIQNYKSSHPNAPVTVMGLSAGTAIVAFALEALPPGITVDHVVMLSGSLSSDYNLTKALTHVTDKMYVFTSQRDEVLGVLVPMAGTADRQSAADGTIGLNGPSMPAGATAETRQQYAKIVRIPWRQQFEQYGNAGGHLGSVSAGFVQAFVAPLVVTAATPPPEPMFASMSKRIANPDYERWNAFPVGSWAEFDGYQVVGGQKQPLHLKATLASKHTNQLIVHRNFTGPSADLAPLASQFYIASQINPAGHPLTDPSASVQEQKSRTVEVGGKQIATHVKTVTANGNYPTWGKNVQATVWSSPNVPGGIVQIKLTSEMDGQKTELFGKLVNFSRS